MNTTKTGMEPVERQKSRIAENLIDSVELKKAAIVLRAIKHPMRQKMLQLLHKHQSLPVTDLYIKMRIEQSVASQQLAILRRSNFVVTKREGKQIIYSINYERLSEVQQLISRLA